MSKVYSQYPNSININTSVPPAVYKARQTVTALPGAVLSPSATVNSVMQIDPTIQVANTYGASVNSGGTTSVPPTINYSLQFGTLEGSIDVSSTGSASYNLDLGLPPGTNNMVPQVSVNYNHNAGEDYMGLGWFIGGLSSIKAVNKTIFLNGAAGPIKLDGNDQYALDGNNLISIGGNNYRLENDNFSLITKYSSYFTVKTKEGLTMEYGNSADSKYSGTTLSKYEFFLNKVSDSYGNYMIYEYENKTTHNEIKIKKISYTGNDAANIPLYNSVNFYYNTKQKSERKFVAGELITESLILRQIEVKAELTASKKYDFIYANRNNHDYLNQIDFYDYDGNKVNPLVFKYGSDAAVTSPCGASVSTQGLTQCVKAMSSDADVAQGDFNGDGKMDVVLFKHSPPSYNNAFFTWTKNFTGYEVILSEGLNTSTGATSISSTLPSGYSSYFAPVPSVADLPSSFSPMFPDIDGDGRSEMIILKNGTSPLTKIVEAYQLNDANTAFVPMPNTFVLSNSKRFIFADYDGDGQQEAIIYQIDASVVDHTLRIFDFNAGTYLPAPPQTGYTITGVATSTTNYKGLSAIDINGDGKDELMTVVNNYNVLLSFSGSSFSAIWTDSEFYQTETPGSHTPKQDYYGDYNGDGNVDFVRVRRGVQATTTTGAVLFYGTGKGFIKYTGENFVNSPGFSDINKKYLSADVNGDKRKDLVVIESSYCVDGLTNLKVFFWDADNIGVKTELGSIEGVLAPVAFELSAANHNYDLDENNTAGIDVGWKTDMLSTFLVGDYNGDGREDILVETGSSKTGTDCPSDPTKGPYLVFTLKPFSTEHLLTEAYDGYGRAQKIVYKSSTEQNAVVYNSTLTTASNNLTTTLSNGVNKFKNQTWLVRTTETPDGIGGTTTNTYTYQGGLTHRLGKGFLGFDKVTNVNSTTGYTTTSDMVINSLPYLDRLTTTNTVKLATANISITNLQYDQLNVGTKIHHVYQKKQTLSDYATLFKTVTDVVKDADGNVTSNIKSTYNNIGATSFLTQEQTVSSNFVSNGTWLPSLPQDITVTLTRQGDPNPYARSTNITYTPEGKPDIITSDLSLDKKVIVDNDYWPSGALKQTLTSAPGGGAVDPLATKLVKLEYDPRHHFVIKTFNPLNQTSQATYDLRYGTPKTEKDITGLTTTYTYDGLGRLTKKVTPDNLVTNITYNWASNDPISGTTPITLAAAPLYNIKTTSQGKPDSKVFYDMFNREVKSEIGGFTQTIHSAKSYDAKGNEALVTGTYYNGSTANVLKTTNAYVDNFNRITSSETTDGITPLTTAYTYSVVSNTYKTTVVLPDGKQEQSITDASGKTQSTIDNAGNVIAYTYYANGNVKAVSFNGTETEAYMYDALGKPMQLTEPNSGLTLYDYNAYGLLHKTTDARNKIFETTYDVLDRPIITNSPGEGDYIYTYYTSGAGLNLLKTETAPSGVINEYSYDNLNRLVTEKSTIAGQLFTSVFTYDNFNNIQTQTYPSGFKIVNEYTANGFLNKIKRNDNGQTIWQADEFTPFGNYNKYTLGNGKQSILNFNNYGILTSKIAAGVQNYSFVTHLESGNVMSRTDNLKVLSETFEYNAQLNRLENVKQNSIITQALTYKPNNNIDTKSGLGTYNYNGTKINQLNTIPNGDGVISIAQQNVTYTNFSKVSTISQNQQNYSIIYGPDKQRAQSIFTNASAQTRTRFYLPSYDKEIDFANITREVNYITSPTGLCAMFVTEAGVNSMYYVYTDHLGSINTITNDAGVPVYEQTFDAWGCKRNVNDWTYDNITTAPNWLWRGFTGHEHLPDYDLIDMNGRIYDPIVSQFVSVDPMLSSYPGQSPYNYALNNPLRYIDPSGEWPIYSSDGSYLGDNGVFEKGKDLAYIGVVTKTDSKGNAIQFGDLKLLTDNHTEFKNNAALLQGEMSQAGNAETAIWMAHTVENARGKLTFNEKFRTTYSSLPDKDVYLSVNDNSNVANYARKGIIDVYSGNADPTGGAKFWDGIDVFDHRSYNLNQAKFRQYQAVSIPWEVLKQATSFYDDVYNRNKVNRNSFMNCMYYNYKIGVEVLNNGYIWRSNWGFTATRFDSQTNPNVNGRIQATGFKSGTIFWKKLPLNK